MATRQKLRTCFSCKRELPIDEFRCVNSTGWRWAEDGRSRRCVDCERASRTAWRHANRKATQSTARRRRSRCPKPGPRLAAWLAVLYRDPCSYCGGESGVIDHVVPVSRGGANDEENTAAACSTCNGRKAAKSLLTFLSGY